MVFVEWSNAPLSLNHLSPSKANELLYGCKLKLLFETYDNSENYPQLIPNHPSAAIGTIIHRVRELALKPWRDDFVEWDSMMAHSCFNEILKEEEMSKMSNEYISHSPPLAATKDFERKKMIAIFEAVQLRKKALEKRIERRRSRKEIKEPTHRIFGSEIKVWNFHKNHDLVDGNPPHGSYTIKGYVDYVQLEDGNVTISDYKTGNYEDGIPEEYLLQITLYSELWRLTSKHLLNQEYEQINLQIETPNKMTPIVSHDAMEVLSKIELQFDNLTTVLQKKIDTETLAQILANPNESSCIWCTRRPGCTVYLDLAQHESPEPDTFDLFGNLVTTPIKSNVNSDQYQFRIRTKDDQIWLVDGVNEKWIGGVVFEEDMMVGVFGGYVKAVENHRSFNYRFHCKIYSHAVFFKR